MSPKFDIRQALQFLNNTQKGMNYGSKKAFSRDLGINDSLVPDFHLDYLAVVGKPCHPLTSDRYDGLLENFEFSYHNWDQPYHAQISDALGFSLKHRTFQFGIGPSREKWYLALHPLWNEEAKEDPRQQARNHKRDARNSALRHQDALILIAWFAEIFQGGNLVGAGVTNEWRLKSPRKASLSYQQWREFQETVPGTDALQLVALERGSHCGLEENPLS